MNPLQRLVNWLRPPAPPAAPPVASRAVSRTSLSGRPSYVELTGFGIPQILLRQVSFRLLDQYFRTIPALSRTVDVLAGFVGVPELVTDSATATENLAAWAANVPYGAGVGMGLKPWIYDLLAQALVFGYGVGEAELAPGRREVARLWTYFSPSCGFETDPTGGLTVIQQTSQGRRTLDPETTTTLTHRPRACDPQGESLFFSIPTVAQTWLDILYAYRSTWRRCGIPTFHISWVPPETFNDPTGAIGQSVVEGFEEDFNEAIRSQAEDGLAKDFYTSGNVTVTTIGADGQVIDIKEAKRNVIEEIVVATGLPGWLLGYSSWSSAERLASQQADMMHAQVYALRTAITGALRKIIDLRQRLAGQTAGLVYEVKWPDFSLQDLRQTSQAALFDAQAKIQQQRYGQQLWADGIWDQSDVAVYLTGNPDVREFHDQPTLFQQQSGVTQARPGALWLPVEAVKEVAANGNGKH